MRAESGDSRGRWKGKRRDPSRVLQGQSRGLDPRKGGTWSRADRTHPQFGAPIHAAPADANAAAAPGPHRPPPGDSAQGAEPGPAPLMPRPLQALPRPIGSATPPPAQSPGAAP